MYLWINSQHPPPPTVALSSCFKGNSQMLHAIVFFPLKNAAFILNDISKNKVVANGPEKKITSLLYGLLVRETIWYIWGKHSPHQNIDTHTCIPQFCASLPISYPIVPFRQHHAATVRQGRHVPNTAKQQLTPKCIVGCDTPNT